MARSQAAAWLPNISCAREFDLRRDAAGAVSATLVSIPQSMAYGLIATSALGPDWAGAGLLAGLFGSIVIGLFAVLLGSCPIVVAGPRAATTLVFAGTVAQLAQMPGLSGTAAVTAALGLGCLTICLSGLFQIGFGALRLGRLASYIPFPVIAGFLNGSALLILLSQVWDATGIPRQKTLLQALDHLESLHAPTLLLSLGTAALILAAPRWIKRIPAPLLGVAAGTAAYHMALATGLGSFGPTMMPLPSGGGIGLVDTGTLAILAEQLDFALLATMVPAAASMATLASLDALLTASAVDALTGHRSQGNRELLAQGLGNVACGAFGLLPGSGSMARTSPLHRAGGRTAVAPVLTALFILAIALALAPLMRFLPQAVMAGLLIAVAIELFDKWSLGLLRRVHWRGPGRELLPDIAAVAVVMGATVAFNLVVAVAVGLLVSFVSFVLRMSRSPIRRCYRASALLPRLHGDEQRRRFVEAHGGSIAVIELEGALFFGSAVALEAKVEDLIGQGVCHIVLDLKRVREVDATGGRCLERLHTRITKAGGLLALAHVERERRQGRDDAFGGENRRRHSADRRVWRSLEQLGIITALGSHSFLPDTDKAAEVCERHLAERLSAEADLIDIAVWRPAILRGLGGADLRRLRPYLTRHAVDKGGVLFRQGDAPDAVYIVAAGRVEVAIDLPRTDRKMRVQTLTPGAIFGEMAVIAPEPRSATVAAIEPTVCYRLPAAAVEELKRREPDIAFALITNVAQIFAERLRATNVMMAELEA